MSYRTSTDLSPAAREIAATMQREANDRRAARDPRFAQVLTLARAARGRL